MNIHKKIDQEADLLIGLLRDRVGSSSAIEVAPVDLDSFREMVAANESILGFETLCEQLCENEMAIDDEIFQRLTTFCRLVGADYVYVSRLGRAS
ncbi:hypothetical protein Cs7R123_30960 [Catellatospora sp. TT07R-123]|uniref:MafI family immunity protein n=1 Tax=Catellatospora sp. TT07R-123 TaxID=2733863 RepID=UPI001B2D40EC|nr:MafI family immunity protein [Catellatospora sp. TT07R-123]GHJ45754.1 hypothetical protein Cs7R123_30960 [Catellatospora sp. TT07R-123]